MDTKKTVWAIVGIVLGVAIMFTPAPEGLTTESMRVLGVLVWAIVFWIGAVLPEAVTAVVMSVLFVILGGVGADVAFAAFSGTTIWLVIPACMIGISVKECGLMERVALMLLKLFPKNFAGRVVGLMVSTFAVGPFVPSTMAKTGILAPIARAISDTAGYQGEGRKAHGMFFAYWTSLKSCSTMFITASVVSVALVGMLPEDVAAQYGLMSWALWSLPVMIPFLILSALFIIFWYGRSVKGDGSTIDEKDEKGSADFVATRLAELGSWTKNEKIAGIIVILTVVLWLTKSFHGINEWAVACIAMALFFVFGIVNMSNFNKQVPWGIIVFVGCAISIGDVLPEVGVTDWITSIAGPMTAGFFSNPFLMTVGVAVFAYIVRFLIVSESGFLAVSTAILFPLAISAGINPWIVAIILNAFTNTFQFPYQSSLLLGTVGTMGEGFIKYNETSFFNIPFCVIFLIGFLIACPVWMATGVMYI